MRRKLPLLFTLVDIAKKSLVYGTNEYKYNISCWKHFPYIVTTEKCLPFVPKKVESTKK